MKSEPGRPGIGAVDSFGVPVSIAAMRAVGGSAEGLRAPISSVAAAAVAAFAFGAADTALAAPTAMPAKNLRRSTFGESVFAIEVSLSLRAFERARNSSRRTGILAPGRHADYGCCRQSDETGGWGRVGFTAKHNTT